MVLTKIQIAGIGDSFIFEGGRVFQYQVAGMPPGENAFLAEFPLYGWRILRWNDEWHGNWTGNYPSADAALEALREELMTTAA
jgi:hypothetical protein